MLAEYKAVSSRAHRLVPPALLLLSSVYLDGSAIAVMDRAAYRKLRGLDKPVAGPPDPPQEKPEPGLLHSLFGRKVVRISEDRVVKSGPNLRAHEAPTLRYVAANTTIPVPRVHDVHWEDGRVTAIEMDYMPGKTLQEVWDTLDHNQKVSIADELHQYVSQLRGLKGDYIGGIDRGKAIIGRRIPVEGGPFESERMFNEFILSDIVSSAPRPMWHYAKYALEDNHEIVFTHADLAPRNILVGENGQVTAILDWEYAGWYPEHWEYIKALRELRPVPGWWDYLSRILPPRYEREYIGMTFLGLVSSS